MTEPIQINRISVSRDFQQRFHQNRRNFETMENLNMHDNNDRQNPFSAKNFSARPAISSSKNFNYKRYIRSMIDHDNEMD